MKKRFELPVWPKGFCDILVCGQKVRELWASDTDHIALKVPDWVEQHMVEKVCHDPRVTVVSCDTNRCFEIKKPEVVRNDSENVKHQVSTSSEDRGTEVGVKDGDNSDGYKPTTKPDEGGFKSARGKTRKYSNRTR
jgi:hypothetical protein